MEKASEMPKVKQSSGTTLHEETHTMKQDGTASSASPSSSSQHMPTGSDKMSTNLDATPAPATVHAPAHRKDGDDVRVVHVHDDGVFPDEVATPQVPRNTIVKDNPRIPDTSQPVEPVKSREQLQAEMQARRVAKQREMDTLTQTKEMVNMPPFPKAMDDKIDMLTLSYTKYSKDGFKMEEVIKFVVECVFELATLTHMYTNIPDDRKQVVVMSAVKKIYKSHNPNLPWIPEPMETMVETMVLDYIVPVLYDSLVKHLYQQGAMHKEKMEQRLQEQEMAKTQHEMEVAEMPPVKPVDHTYTPPVKMDDTKKS